MKMISLEKIKEENAKQLVIICENFKALRRTKGWSVKELSEKSGINEKILTGIEAGEDFDVQYLIKLCCIYNIKPHKILSYIV